MKTLITALLLTLSFSGKAFATVDAPTLVYLVVADLNEEDNYTVVTMYTEGCYGVDYGPQAAAFTEAFKITAGMGCGMKGSQLDINALSCASSDYKWDEGHTKVEKVSINLAKCHSEMKNSSTLKPAIVEAAKRNFGHTVEIAIK